MVIQSEREAKEEERVKRGTRRVVECETGGNKKNRGRKKETVGGWEGEAGV